MGGPRFRWWGVSPLLVGDLGEGGGGVEWGGSAGGAGGSGEEVRWGGRWAEVRVGFGTPAEHLQREFRWWGVMPCRGPAAAACPVEGKRQGSAAAGLFQESSPRPRPALGATQPDACRQRALPDPAPPGSSTRRPTAVTDTRTSCVPLRAAQGCCSGRSRGPTPTPATAPPRWGPPPSPLRWAPRRPRTPTTRRRCSPPRCARPPSRSASQPPRPSQPPPAQPPQPPPTVAHRCRSRSPGRPAASRRRPPTSRQPSTNSCQPPAPTTNRRGGPTRRGPAPSPASTPTSSSPTRAAARAAAAARQACWAPW